MARDRASGEQISTHNRSPPSGVGIDTNDTDPLTDITMALSSSNASNDIPRDELKLEANITKMSVEDVLNSKETNFSSENKVCAIRKVKYKIFYDVEAEIFERMRSKITGRTGTHGLNQSLRLFARIACILLSREFLLRFTPITRGVNFRSALTGDSAESIFRVVVRVRAFVGFRPILSAGSFEWPRPSRPFGPRLRRPLPRPPLARVRGRALGTGEFAGRVPARGLAPGVSIVRVLDRFRAIQVPAGVVLRSRPIRSYHRPSP